MKKSKSGDNQNSKNKVRKATKSSTGKNSLAQISQSSANKPGEAFVTLLLSVDPIVLKNLMANLQGFIRTDLHQKIQSELDDLENISSQIDTSKIKDLENHIFQIENLSFKNIVQSKVVQEQYKDQLVDFRSTEKSAELARQIAHDIRSPLSALNMLIPTLNNIPEEKKVVILESLSRINDMASALLARCKELQKTAGEIRAQIEKSVSLAELVNTLILEKRVQHQMKSYISLESNFSNAYTNFVQVDPFGLKRVLSNIIENAIEAIECLHPKITNGVVQLFLTTEDNSSNSRDLDTVKYVSIHIKDNGRGIESEFIDRVGEKGFTFGKGTNGNGIGVHSAKEWLNENNGQFEIKSHLGKGTEVIISIPMVKTPAWFLPKLSIAIDQKILIIDDDVFVHKLWKDRLEHLGFKGEIIHFYSIAGFTTEYKTEKNILYLIDHDFKDENMTGLQAIEKFDLASQAILCTNRSDDPALLQKIQLLNIQLIPKLLALHLPIFFS